MAALRVIITILYVLICVALVVVVLMQEGNSEGLSGAINGVADTYWGKNKGRSMEGTLMKATKILPFLSSFLCDLSITSLWMSHRHKLAD